MQKTILSVVGARPQFIKSAPLEMALQSVEDYRLISLHTGQHYDENMSRIFFEELGLKTPAYQLEAGSGKHGKQTAKMLEGIESVLEKENPAMVVVFGDTNSTLAAALAAAKMNIPIAHIEAGLRSFNRSMPEEINRVLTDHISSLLFVPGNTAITNLSAEGISKGVENSGDIMLDILRTAQEKNVIKKQTEEKYYYATIHRPYNTDLPERMLAILKEMNELDLPVYFSIHPRTSALLEKQNINIHSFSNIHFIPPQSYFDNLGLMAHAERIITDSGGLQKEAWFLKKPCITLRPETEWIETLENQWNVLIYDQISELRDAIKIIPGKQREGVYGDGHAAERIRDSIIRFLAI